MPPFDVAYGKALQEMKLISPYVTASQSGALFDGEKFRLPFFHRTFLISFPEIKVEEMGAQAAPPHWIQTLLFHYLLNARGMAVADQWIAYRNLPGAQLFEAKFQQNAIRPLVQAFGHDIEGFRRAGEALEGTPMSRTGDAAFRFLAFPLVPMASILYLGDDEVQPSVTILFDASAPSYLPTDDLYVTGIYLGGALRSHPAKASRNVA
ncbi:MAG: DUF3786 domain-containing protein [Chloroflexota bacterium]|nr:DUF3786 domain-containing protein [Chloroflexota bacterium]